MTDKVVISGSSGAIGGAIARLFHDGGYQVIGLDLVEPEDSCIRHIATNLSDVESRDAALDEIWRSTDRIDCLVNCAAQAGIRSSGQLVRGFVDEDEAFFRSSIEVNLIAPYILSRSLLPLLLRSKKAAIINIASIYGLLGPVPNLYDGLDMTCHASYAASKGGLIQLTRYLASALGPKVRVNAVAPGGVQSNQPDEFVSRYERLTPLQRMATSQDVARAVTWLASEEASYITGQVLAVDGGWTVV